MNSTALLSLARALHATFVVVTPEGTVGEVVTEDGAESRTSWLGRSLCELVVEPRVAREAQELARRTGGPVPLALLDEAGQRVHARLLPCGEEGCLLVLTPDEPFARFRELTATNARLQAEVVTRRQSEEALARSLRELEEAERRAAASERMAALGRLAAGVAHEVNNPLTYVLGNLDAIFQELLDTQAPDWLDMLRDARDGALRVRGIIRQLGVFARLSRDEPVRVVLDDVVRKGLRRVEASLPGGAQAEIVAGLSVRADPVRLGQVLASRLDNAVQAGATRVVVRARTEGDFVVVEVEDDGPGIPPELRERIFEPFFTTREPTVASGLGLAFCHGALSAWGGELSVRSVVGEGTTFVLSLPTVPLSTWPPPERTREASLFARARVAVVDDEPKLVEWLHRSLHACHTVDVFPDGQSFLDAVARGRRWHVVLCDLSMPGVDGERVYRALEENSPDLARAFVLMTGGALRDEQMPFLESMADRTLPKPFTTEQLRERMADLLGLPRQLAALSESD
ncbi:MAG: ATP-binding protein [Polyangiales bacterium]